MFPPGRRLINKFIPKVQLFATHKTMTRSIHNLICFIYSDVNNSTNVSEKPTITPDLNVLHIKKTTTYDVGISGHGLGQAPKRVGA